MLNSNDVEGSLKHVLGKDVLMDTRRQMLAIIQMIELVLERVYGVKLRH